VDSSYIPVQARRGSSILEKATIDWREIDTVNEGRYLVIVEIPRQVFKGGKYKVEWPTALCGNSDAKAEFDLDIPLVAWGPGGPGYIPPADSPVAGVPFYAGAFSPGISGGGGGGSPPEYPSPLLPPSPPSPPPPSVPLPSTLLLLGSGLVGLWKFGWKKGK